MFCRIINVVKKYSKASILDSSKIEFDIGINRINIVRAKVTSITFIILECIMLIIYCVNYPDSLFNKPNIYYGVMYVLMLIVMIIFLLAFIRFGKDISAHLVHIRYAGIFFSTFILMWCAGISLLDQQSSGQVIVYVVAVISIAVTPFYEPLSLFLMYLVNHTLFLLLLPHVQKSFDIMVGNSINTTFFVIIAWAISCMRYRSQVEDFINKEMIREKSDELKLINEELEKVNRKLEIQSQIDGLTGIYNRLTFNNKIKDEWERCKVESLPLSLIMADIDFFKSYNDNYGHQTGDDCLKQIAEILLVCTQGSQNIVSRFGGEEFVVILPDTQYEKANETAEHIRQMVDETTDLTISLGVNTLIPHDGISYEEFINYTDKALYMAKEKRNCLISWNDVV